MQSAIKQIN